MSEKAWLGFSHQSRLGPYRLVAVMATALLFDFAAALAFVVLMN